MLRAVLASVLALSTTPVLADVWTVEEDDDLLFYSAYQYDSDADMLLRFECDGNLMAQDIAIQTSVDGDPAGTLTPAFSIDGTAVAAPAFSVRTDGGKVKYIVFDDQPGFDQLVNSLHDATSMIEVTIPEGHARFSAEASGGAIEAVTEDCYF